MASKELHDKHLARVTVFFGLLCQKIEQPYAINAEEAEAGDWYLDHYTTEEYQTYAIMERLPEDEREDGGEDRKISSDLTIEGLVCAFGFVDMFLTAYNENMQ